jgi:dihydroxyacetone kinase
MALTEFGKAVRKARIDANETLVTMAKALETTPAFLSAMETGSKKIADKWVKLISSFFEEKGIHLEKLEDLAASANEVVSVEGLTHQQKMLVAGFAKSPWNPDQLKQFAELLEQINNQQEGLNNDVSVKRSKSRSTI